MEKRYDVVILGGGGGAYPAAFQLARAGRSVFMVDEKGNLGGNCLFEGCIPSKAVREATRRLYEAQRGAFFGFTGAAPELAWPGIRAYKDGIQTRRYAQHREEIEEEPQLTFVRGRGELLGGERVRVEDVDRGTEEVVQGGDLILATGSEAVELPIPGFAATWNHHDLFAWREAQEALPTELAILGGGYIGVETASMLSDLGLRVTLIEMAPRILPGMDEELASFLAAELSSRVRIETGVRVDAIRSLPAGRFVVEGEQGGGAFRLETERVLAAVGRRPHLPQDLGLDRLDVAYDRHGIAVDGRMRTSRPHVYAPGDVNGRSMLFHAAVRMSEVAAADILAGGEGQSTFRAEEMPATVFARPEGMSVGLTAEEARRRGLAVFEERRRMGVEAWAQIVGETEGFFKFVVARRSGAIVGVQAAGAEAAALSAVAHVIVRLGLTLGDVAQMTFPHPTQFEVVDRLARRA